MSVVLCRPTVSGDMMPVAMGNYENIEEATKYNDVKPPNGVILFKNFENLERNFRFGSDKIDQITCENVF